MWCDPPMRDVVERLLDHAVSTLLPAEAGAGGPVVAVSSAGDPVGARVAWVDIPGRRVLARVACPPGRPSRFRPVVASVVALDAPGLPGDRVMVAHVAPSVHGVRPALLDEADPPAAPVDHAGLSVARVGAGAVVIAVDALDHTGEPVGRLVRAGISELRFDGTSVGGHLRATHGMAAGIGAGRWAADAADAEFEAGYRLAYPRWMPPGLAPGRPHVEPDQAYPAAPPALVLSWDAADGARVLLRQAPAPLASPDPGGRHARPVVVGGWPGVLRGYRRLVTLVWETDTRAFGVQVRGMVAPEAVAVRVAEGIQVPGEG